MSARSAVARCTGSVLLVAAFAAPVLAQDSTSALGSAPPGDGPRPPSGLVVTDVPNDAGRALDLTWRPSADDRHGTHLLTQYRLERATSPSGPWTVVDSVGAGTTTKQDQTVVRNTDY